LALLALLELLALPVCRVRYLLAL